MFKLNQVVALCLVLGFSAPALAWTTITVRSGQTLSGISTHYSPNGVAGQDMLKALKKLNPNLAKRGLQAGMKLKVPTTRADIRDTLSSNKHHRTVRSTQSKTSKPVNRSSAVSSVSHRLSECQTTMKNLQRALNNQSQNLQNCQAEVGKLDIAAPTPVSTATGMATAKKSGGWLSFADLWFVLWLLTFILLWRSHLKSRDADGQPSVSKPRSSVGPSGFDVQPAEPTVSIKKKEPQVAAPTNEVPLEPTDADFPDTDTRQVELDIPTAGGPAQTQMPLTPSLGPQAHADEWAGEQKNIIDAIANDHDNIDWHMALLEFYTKTRNEQAYIRHMETMIRTGLMSEGDSLWEKIRRMYLNAWIYNEESH